jgi:topoisomerase-4 subunit A
VIVETLASLLETYETGRGGVRTRARWTREDSGRGGWRIIVTQIPYQVKKADLVEQLAGLIEAKRAPLLGDIRDESAEDIRLVIEPRSRTTSPEVLMESLFRLSDLETRFPVNINVLDGRGTPVVMGLKSALLAFLAHRREVLVRRAKFRLGKIDQRLHVLDGLLIVFLDLDEVIRIVRFEDEPKAKLIATFELSDIQAEAILNTRLRQLAKLEEMELRREHALLAEEKEVIEHVLASEAEQWKLVGVGLRDVRKTLGPSTPEGRRRSTFAQAPLIALSETVDAFVAREPITVILSDRGWIRAVRGKIDDLSTLQFKEGDKLAFAVPAETTDKLMIFASDGRFFTIAGDKLPPGRGQGEPLRLMIEVDDKVGILAMFPHRPGNRRIVASKAGYGFVLVEDDAVALRRAGKQVLTVEGQGAALSIPAEGDHLAVIGDNGKIVIFPLAELPQMARGKGVKLQSYRQGGLRDAVAFAAEEGAAWIDSAGRTRLWTDWRTWLGRRASAGRLAPRGFPASKRFRPR